METASLLPWGVYGLGLALLAASVLLDLYLSVLPHLAVAVGAVMLYGWTWDGAAAFVIPHLALFVVSLARGQLGGGGSAAGGQGGGDPAA